jgi:signal transduction histidine kinase
MTLFKPFIIGAVAAFGLVGPTLAQTSGTRDEAKATVEAAVAHAHKVGAEQAFKDFTTDKANWNRKDLYVMAYDNNGKCVGHGANEKLIGKVLIDLKDPNGKLLIQELIKTAKNGGGWVDYEWGHPQTKKLESKSTYAMKLNNFDGWVGVGVYR